MITGCRRCAASVAMIAAPPPCLPQAGLFHGPLLLLGVALCLRMAVSVFSRVANRVRPPFTSQHTVPTGYCPGAERYQPFCDWVCHRCCSSYAACVTIGVSGGVKPAFVMACMRLVDCIHYSRPNLRQQTPRHIYQWWAE
jgi:hypothetical protein